MKTVPVEFLDDLGRLALFENRPAAELEAIVRSRARHPSARGSGSSARATSSRGPISCLTVPGSEVQAFLVGHPVVLCRMLRIEARRLRTAWGWGT